MRLGDRKAGVRANLRWFERQYDAVARNATFRQNFGDSIGRAIMLNDYPAIANIYMQNGSVNATSPIPARVNQFVVIVCLVENDLCLDVSGRGFILRILFNQPTISR